MKNVAFVSLTAIVAAAASADTVQMHFGGVAQGNSVSIRINGGSSVNVFAGSVIHDIDEVRTVTYCIDPDQWASTGTNTFERTNLDEALSHRSYSSDKAYAVAELAGLAGQDIWSETGSRDLATAFQLAAWEVILDYDPDEGAESLDLSSGDFRASGRSHSSLSDSIEDLVNQLFEGMQFGETNLHRYAAYTNSKYQDFMSQVPAPGSAALALIGLPLLATRKR